MTALFFLPNALGIQIPSHLNWFVSSLFWGSVLYYFLWKVVDNKKFYYIVATIVFCVYCILLNKLNLYAAPKVWNGIFTYFLLRAIAGIGLGLLFGAYFLQNKPCEITHRQKIVWAVLDLVLLAIIIDLAVFMGKRTAAFPIMMTCFVVLFYSFLFKMSYFAKFIGCKFIVWAAKYSYSAYIMQIVVFIILENTLYMHPVWGVRQYPIGNIIFSLCTVYLVSIVVYHLVESPLRKLILAKLAARQAGQRS